MLPKIENKVLQDINFPTKWQTVIFRNYSFIPTERIAKVLGTDLATVDREAERLGLPFEPDFLDFDKKGYLTVIRNNWYVLPYDQLTTVINMTKEQLAFTLKEEDFFSEKLGGTKPRVEHVIYSQLDDKEIKETEKIAKVIKKYLRKDKVKPFNFFPQTHSITEFKSDKGSKTMIIHGYLSPCGNAFAGDSREYLPDSLLLDYAKKGINGIWLHAMLSMLSYYPFRPGLSKGYEKNRRQLKELIRRASKFGIKIYLYLNEPRSIPLEYFTGIEHIKGTEKKGYGSLCTSTKQVQDYIYNAVKDLAVYLQNLGGIFNITMSENLTHCKSHVWTKCPRCSDTPAQELCANVINIIAKALRDSGTGAEMIANLWGWSPHLEMTEKQMFHGIDIIDKDVSILETSEYWLDLNKGGVSSNLVDYSISNPGPSKLTAAKLIHAKNLGHKTYAKVQINNSWECSTVPYLPAFDLIVEHLNNLKNIGVSNLLMSWTLGGYPSKSLDLVKDYYASDNFDIDTFYAKNFRYPKPVKKAVGLFCEGFKEYPFSVVVVYFSPHTMGPANLWSLEKDNKRSSMVGLSFDDYESYIKPYTYAVYTRQMRKMLNKFKKAVKVLQENRSSDTLEVLRYIKVAYIMFKADLLHTRFARYKSNVKKNKKIISHCLVGIRELAAELIAIMAEDTYVGFETSNHYFFTERNLLEKIINTDNLIEKIAGM